MIYSLDYDYAGMLIAIMTIFIVLIRKDLKRVENLIFLIMVGICAATCLFDILSVYSSNNPGWVPVGVSYFFYFAYMLLHTTFAPYCFAYILLLSGFGFSEKWLKAGAAAIAIPYILTMLVIVLNPIFHWVFYLDEHCGYHRGNMIVVLYVCAFLYLAAMYVVMVRFHRAFTSIQLVVLIVFWLGSLIAVGFQYFHPDKLLEMFSQAVVCMGISISITDEDVLYDPKTKLYNRNTFIADNSRMIRAGRECVVVIIRLLNTPNVISVIGYDNYHRVTESLTEYLKQLCKEEKLTNAYTLENNNYAVLYRFESPEKTRNILRILEKRFREPWSAGRAEVFYKAQIIAVGMPMDFSDINSVLSVADRKYYPSNETAVYFGADLDRIKRYQLVEKALESAVEKKSIEVYYQPIWDCTDNRIHTCEALIRLIDDQLGFIPTDELVRVAENNGMILPIGVYVFEEVCRFISDYKLRDYGIEFVEINLSTLQCLQEDLADTLSFLLGKYGVPASSISLCIKESTVVENEEAIRRVVEKLRGIGFIISMDNLGTGYSNLKTLFNTRFDIIKIDRTVLWNADDNVAGDIILENTVNTIRQMDSRIAIAGVETQEHKEKIIRHHIDYGQGYVFSRPLRGTEAIDYIKGFNEQ